MGCKSCPRLFFFWPAGALPREVAGCIMPVVRRPDRAVWALGELGKAIMKVEGA
jgi:hypothetical protein